MDVLKINDDDDDDHFSAEITTPSGKKHFPKVIDNRNGTVAIAYSPEEVGLHQLAVSYNDVPIDGSPFQFYVDSVTAGHVTAYGPGLSHGICGKKCNFTVVTKDAGAGQILALVYFCSTDCNFHAC